MKSLKTNKFLRKNSFFNDVSTSLIKPGDFLKIATKHERFWTIVYAIGNGTFIVIVDNYLVEDYDLYDFGDYVEIEHENIFDYIEQ